MDTFFKHALPVWLSGRNREKNVRAQFKAVVCHKIGQSTAICLATSGTYQLTVNGVFVAYGPARAGGGHFRVDQWDISHLLRDGENAVVVEVAGYYVNSYYIQKNPSFLQAEIVTDGEAVLWTGRDFSARLNPHYIQRIQRYSWQRPLTESYRVKPGDTFLQDLTAGSDAVATVESGVLEPRIAPYPRFERLQAESMNRCGSVSFAEPAQYVYPEYVTDINDILQGYTKEELEICLTEELQQMTFSPAAAPFGGQLPANSYELYRLPCNRSGIIHCSVECAAPMTLYVLFEEIMTEDLPNFGRSDSVTNIVRFDLPAGRHDLKLHEVYTAQYIQLVARGGACTVESVGMIEYAHEPVEQKIYPTDPVLAQIASAALQSFRQNSVDILTDCPSRERAGFLCDSYFTAQAEFFLTGGNPVEKSFLENFLHEENYVGIPEDVLPMCYPADHYAGYFIPNWPMWMILELKAYLERTGDRDLIDRFEGKIRRFLAYLIQFENEDGLLEKLDGIVFVDASRSNFLRQDVNYPTNMLYAHTLLVADELYGMPEAAPKAARIRKEVLRQSFNGKFFVDNAVRKDGKLELSGECTESCQYYAFLFDVVDDKTHGELFRTLVQDFGPGRDEEKTFPDMGASNAFMGYFLRMDMLKKYELWEDLLTTIKGYYATMAAQTGTLWEYRYATNSCNHGVGSYSLYLLDLLKKKGLTV